MNKIILSILLICGLNGQDYWIDDGIWRGQEYADSVWNSRFDTTLIWRHNKQIESIPIEDWDGPNEYFIVTYIYLYEQYEAECYNDSTEVTFGVYKAWDTGIEFKTVYTYESYRYPTNLVRKFKGFTHKEPTFHGFMEWLKEKQ